MKNRILLTLMSGILALSASGQDLVLYAGLSQSAMKDLKELQKLAANQAPVTLKYTNTFPIYWQYSFSGRWALAKKDRLGFFMYTTSTGARSTYEDYSGVITQDFAVKCWGLTVHYEHLFLKKEKSEASFYVEAGLVRSELTFGLFAQVGNDIETDEETFNSRNELAEGGIQYKYFIKPQLFLESRIGIQANLQGKLENKDGDYLILTQDDFVGCDWSGLKISVGIGYRFNQ